MQPTKETMRRLAASLCDQFEAIDRPESRGPVPAPDLPGVPEEGRGYDALPELWSLVVAGSANLAAPMTMAHMDTAPHPAAALSDAVVSALNNNLLFRELSPLSNRIEESLVALFIDALGLDAEWTGTFLSGGSLANLTALFAACGGFAERTPWDQSWSHHFLRLSAGILHRFQLLLPSEIPVSRL